MRWWCTSEYTDNLDIQEVFILQRGYEVGRRPLTRLHLRCAKLLLLSLCIGLVTVDYFLLGNIWIWMTILCLDHAYIRSFLLSALLDDSVDVDKNVKVWGSPIFARLRQRPKNRQLLCCNIIITWVLGSHDARYRTPFTHMGLSIEMDVYTLQSK
jgi:hypothetical protein